MLTNVSLRFFFYLWFFFSPRNWERSGEQRKKRELHWHLRDDFSCGLEDLFKKSQGKEWEMTGQWQDCNSNWDYSQQNPTVLICYMNFTTEEKGQLTSINFHHSRFYISAPKVLPMLSLNSSFVSSIPWLLLTTSCSALSTSFLPTV